MAEQQLVTMRVEGLRELQRAIGNLPRALALPVYRDLLRKATRPTFLAAKAYAELHRVSGSFAMAMSMRSRPGRKVPDAGPNALVVIRIGPNPRHRQAREQYARYYDKPRVPDRLNHFHLVEHGSRNNTAKAPLRKGMDATWKQAVSTVAKDWERTVQRTIQRQTRRLERKAVRLASRAAGRARA